MKPLSLHTRRLLYLWAELSHREIRRSNQMGGGTITSLTSRSADRSVTWTGAPLGVVQRVSAAHYGRRAGMPGLIIEDLCPKMSTYPLG